MTKHAPTCLANRHDRSRDHECTCGALPPAQDREACDEHRVTEQGCLVCEIVRLRSALIEERRGRVTLYTLSRQFAPVHPVREEYERTRRAVQECAEWLRSIGEKDPRSSGFVAERALDRLAPALDERYMPPREIR